MTSVRRPLAILAAVAFANFVFAALSFGLAAAGPVIREQLQVGEAMLGVVLAASPAGLMIGTLGWGELADRMDERRVLGGAFTGFAAATAVSAQSIAAGWGVGALCVALFFGGVFGSAAHSAGGRAISAAFPPHRHGLVLSIRHTVIPIGGAAGGLLIPALGRQSGLELPLMLLSIAGLVAALGVVAGLPSVRLSRGVGRPPIAIDAVSPLRVRSLWLLGLGGAGLAFVQLGIGSFLTVRLVDEAGVSLAAAAATYAIAQLTGAACRIVLGIASDRIGHRVALLRGVVASVVALVVAVLLVPSEFASGELLVVAFVVATCWNGVAVAAAAALAPPGRTGATLGMQTTLNAAACAVAPLVLGAVIDGAGWTAFECVLLVSLALSAVCLTALGRSSDYQVRADSPPNA